MMTVIDAADMTRRSPVRGWTSPTATGSTARAITSVGCGRS